MDVLLATALALAAPQAADTFTPPRLLTGGVAHIPVMQVTGGEVFFEAALDAEGRVAALKPLRTTAGLTEPVADAIRGWRFLPPLRRASGGPPIGATVLVGALFRQPALVGPTLGAAPVTVAVPGAEVPAPLTVQAPAFPPMAFGPGVVLLELRIEADGSVSDASVIGSAPPFDRAAVDAAKQWQFHPARFGGRSVATYAYVLFGFPLPVG